MADERSGKLTWKRWVLDSPDAMAGCLQEMIAMGRKAQINASATPTGEMVWLLEIEGEHRKTPVLANMGMVVVHISNRVEAMTKADYAVTFRDNV